MAYLPRLKRPGKKTRKEIPDFAVFDIESSRWVDFLALGYFDGKTERYRHFLSLPEFARWAFSAEQERKVLFAHFGGIFDFLFMLKEFFTGQGNYHVSDIIPRGAMLLSFSVHELVEQGEGEPFIDGEKMLFKGRKIEFRDSGAMLPFGLESLTNSFGVEHKKLKMDFTNLISVTPELLEYLEYDCRGLWECMNKFFDWEMVKSAGAAYTIAGQAVKVYRNEMPEDLEIKSLTTRQDEFVRGAYFGGRTEIFKPVYEGGAGNLLCLDVNSLYPAVMLNDMPTNFAHFTREYDPNSMGFYDAVVDVPEWMYVPPLGVIQKVGKTSKYIFPTGRIQGRFSTLELEYARSIGCKIVATGKGAVFQNGGKIFEKYIKKLYDIRLKSPKDSVDNVLAKLLMNSLYGRMGLRRDREKISIDRCQLGAEPFFEMQTGPNEYFRLVKEPIVLDKTFTNVGISAWITSHARVHMHKIYMKNPELLYYTDTDSLFTTKKFESDENELGALKMEYSLKKACFLLPKTYRVEFSDEWVEMLRAKGRFSEHKTVMKGFPKDKIQHFSHHDFMQAFEGELRILKVRQAEKMARFGTAMRHGEFLRLMPESDREIRSRYDKRRILKTSNGYDTEPLCVRDGEVVNYTGGMI